MVIVPQPVTGSVAITSRGMPQGLSPGLYLDRDVAIWVSTAEVTIIAPTLDQAKLLAANLPKNIFGWQEFLVNHQDLVKYGTDYAAWLKLAGVSIAAGELEYESRESEEVAKTVSGAVS